MMTWTLIIAAIAATVIAAGLHLLILVRSFRQSKRVGLSYIVALLLASILWLVAYNTVTRTTGQVNQEGMSQFEEQKKMLDEMDDLQIELPSSSAAADGSAGRIEK